MRIGKGHVNYSSFARKGLGILALGLLAFNATAQQGKIPVVPIPQQLFGQPVPAFVGQPAIPERFPARPVPQSPYMAPNGSSGVHLDAYQSDTYAGAGPLGHAPEVNSTFLASLCGTVTFDKQGRIVTVCVGPGPIGPNLYLLDPVTLQTLTKFALPDQGGNGQFGAGGYFFLDNLDRAVIPTRGNDIWRIRETDTAAGPIFLKEHTCASDLPAVVGSNEEILSTFPDANGLLWFTTSGNSDDPTQSASVGTAKPDPSDSNHCVVKTYQLPSGELIQKSFAVDPDPSRGGVFVVSDHQLYRFDADATGVPSPTWQEVYDRGLRVKPGQRVRGSGTTPTLMGTHYVTIADNASPRMHVLVYRRAARSKQDRLVCSEPVFQAGKSDTFNSLDCYRAVHFGGE